MNLRFRRSGLDFSRRRRKVNKTLAKEVGTWIGEIAIAVLFALVLVYFVGCGRPVHAWHSSGGG